jgi:hypothetical protein
MNEAEIRERLRQAVGDSPYPAGFSSRVEAQLQHSTRDQHHRNSAPPRPRPWLVSLGRAGSLVGALLVVLLMASLVLGVHFWLMNTHPVVPAAPLGRSLTIKQYQALVRADQQRLDSEPGGYCSITDTECPAVAALNTAAMQQWLDDLNHSQPPARFAAVDALMRRQLALAISYQNAAMTAYRARDQKGVETAFAAGASELDVLDRQAGDIIASTQGTMVTYTTAVRMNRALLLACDLCQLLLSQDQVTCQSSQTPTCVDEIAAVRGQVEAFQADLIKLYAPDSLAAKDGRLQADLVAADTALDAMTLAQLADDQAALQAGHDALRRAINRVESDASDIAGSN